MEIVEGLFIAEYGILSNVSQEPVDTDFHLWWPKEEYFDRLLA